MPTYDYRCPSCGAEEEVQHGMKEIDTPSAELIETLTCYCKDYESTLMKRHYKSAPAITTMTKSRVSYDPVAKQKVKKDRKERSDEHFRKEVYPTLPKSERSKFSEKHGLKT